MFSCKRDKKHENSKPKSGPGGHSFPTPLHSKKKKGKQRKTKMGFRAETVESFSPRSKCYCFSHRKAPRIQKFFLSANHGGRQYFWCSMAPPLWNPFRRPWKLVSVVSMNLSRKKEIRPHIKIFMFPIARPSLLKSTDPNFFFRKNLKKIIENLYLFTKKVRDLHLLCHLIWFKFD